MLINLWGYKIAKRVELNANILDMDNELVEETFEKDKSRAEKRRLDRVKNTRKETLKPYVNNTICPEEKRLRKKKSVRKARYSKEEHSFGSYKKCCDINL